MTTGKTLCARLNQDIARDRPKGMNDGTYSDFLGAWKATRGVIEGLAMKEETIRNSPRWNKWDKQDLLKKDVLPLVQGLIATHLQDRGRLETTLSHLNKTLGSVAPRVTDPVARQLRGQEIRGLLRNVGQAERVALFSEALASNDTDTLDAVISAPDNVIPKEVVRRGL